MREITACLAGTKTLNRSYLEWLPDLSESFLICFSLAFLRIARAENWCCNHGYSHAPNPPEIAAPINIRMMLALLVGSCPKPPRAATSSMNSSVPKSAPRNRADWLLIRRRLDIWNPPLYPRPGLRQTGRFVTAVQARLLQAKNGQRSRL